MSEQLPTREDDFDREFSYSLWDFYADQVNAGDITLEQAQQFYLEDMAQASQG